MNGDVKSSTQAEDHSNPGHGEWLRMDGRSLSKLPDNLRRSALMFFRDNMALPDCRGCAAVCTENPDSVGKRTNRPGGTITRACLPTEPFPLITTEADGHRHDTTSLAVSFDEEPFSEPSDHPDNSLCHRVVGHSDPRSDGAPYLNSTAAQSYRLLSHPGEPTLGPTSQGGEHSHDVEYHVPWGLPGGGQEPVECQPKTYDTNYFVYLHYSDTGDS